MRVVDLTGSQRPLKVEITVSPAYELLMSLSLFTMDAEERPLYEGSENWIATAGKRASPELLAELAAIPIGKMWMHLLGLVYTTPAPRDAPSFLSTLEMMPALDFRLQILGAHYGDASRHGISRDTVIAAAHGDTAALEKAVATWFGDHPEHEQTFRALLAEDPETTKAATLRVLTDWYEQVFRPEEDRVMSAIRRDADAKCALLKNMAPERLIEIATNGVRYYGEPGIEVVVLIPSVFSRPWVMLGEQGPARLFCYPVADESLIEDVHAPPAHLVRVYEALADERRLRVLRKIAEEPSTLQELADFLGIAKSTMHHHLAILRGAGLLSLELHGKRYTLRREALGDLSALLEGYLGR